MYTQPFDLAPYDFVWIVVFKFGDWRMRWPMGTFVSIHDLISYYDDGLRSSVAVYSRVRKCFDMLYLERVKREFADACDEYHKLPNRPLQYETYCAFMETYRVCMKDGNGDDYRIYPTETEEQYLSLVIDERKWAQACDEMKRNRRNRNVDVDYLDDQLKSNTELKEMIIKLVIQRKLNLGKYRAFSAVEGVYYTLIDVLNIVQSKYVISSNVKTHEQMDQAAETFLQSELRKYAAQALHEERVDGKNLTPQAKLTLLIEKLRVVN